MNDRRTLVSLGHDDDDDDDDNDIKAGN